MNNLSKLKIISELPIVIGDIKIRELTRVDLDNYANWPMYEGYKSMFNSSLKSRPESDRDLRWISYKSGTRSVALVVDIGNEKTIGMFYLLDIDWSCNEVGNMSIRLHPNYCDKGIGTKVLKEIVKFCFNIGINSLSLDVLESNISAVRSYEKSGFKIVEELMNQGDKFLIMRVCKTTML